MKGKLFIHNPLFRLLVPPVYGFMVYLFILTLFDSLYQIKENFFSYEVLQTVIMTYLLMEGLRMIILLLNRYYPKKRIENLRIVIQVGISVLYGALVASAVISFYFYVLVGYSSFLTEFLTFNIIFILSAILYTMVYYSVYYLTQQNVVMLSKEHAIRENLEFELESFKNEINPQFLYESLESLISLIHKDPLSSEKFISHLSGFYRYKLASKKNELVDVKDEVEATKNFIRIMNVKYEDNIHLKVDGINEVEKMKMVPGSLQDFTEYAVRNSIITKVLPLLLSIRPKGNNSIIFSYRQNDQLNPDRTKAFGDMNVVRAYRFYSDQPLEMNSEKEVLEIDIPLLEILDEEI